MKNKVYLRESLIEIAGAGPAGLAAAIHLAQAGQRVIVHEAKESVGYRFRRDFQGLDNWTSKKDVLSVFKEQGLTTEFTAMPCRSGIAYDSKRRVFHMHSDQPLFYVVERGPNKGSLDSALLNQALELGVEIRFNSRLKTISDLGILAAGPKTADAIAVGYHFETDLQNGYWAICDNDLAPQGYAYLLVMDGFGTIKTCIFSDFGKQKSCLERTVSAFEELVGLKMKNPKFHGGAGNFRIPDSAYSGKHPLVGEQAGFQDTLWGFGMRLAISSGLLAAKSLLHQENYDELWKKELKAQMETSVVNRQLFAMMRNPGYTWLLRYLSHHKNLQGVFASQYHTSVIKRLMYPWAKKRYQSSRSDVSCQEETCQRVWCDGS